MPDRIYIKTLVPIFVFGLLFLVLGYFLIQQNRLLRFNNSLATETGIMTIDLPSVTLSPSLTPTNIIPSFTPVTAYPPSLTPITPTLGPRSIWPPSTNFMIDESQTEQGMFLSIESNITGETYHLGPLARGDYAIGPSDRYLVYMTSSGQLMAIRLGRDTFTSVKNMARLYTAIARKIVPSFSFSFYNNGYSVTVIVTENHYGQDIPVILPRSVTY